MDREATIAYVRSVIDSGPQKPEDFISVKWPTELGDQSLVVRRLARIVQQPAMGWRLRAFAYNFLESKAKQLGETIQSGDEFQLENVPSALKAWSFQVVSGMVEPPKAPKGRDPSASAIRDYKMLTIEKSLRRDGGYTKEEAVSLIAEAMELSEEGAVSALRRIEKVIKHLTTTGFHEGGPNLWGEKIS